MPHSLTPEPLLSGAVTSLRGEVSVPGDKSISHRALILGSQNVGQTVIHGLLEGEDVLGTAAALRALGASIAREANGEWRVQGVGTGGFSEPNGVLDMGNSGTGVRLMMGLVATHPFTTFFTGDASLRGRPMRRVMGPLEEMGARFVARRNDYLPLAVIGAEMPMPMRYTLPVASAQVKTAILLAALNTPGETAITEPERSRDHTERMFAHYGIPLRVEDGDKGARVLTLTGQPEVHHSHIEIHVPGDPSSAAFLAVAALITPDSKVILRNVCMNPLRTGLYDTLCEMGADMWLENERENAGEPVADLVVRSSKLKGVDVPAERAPSMIDEYPILAVAAACAKGVTTMRGLKELKVKESNRLAAIADGLIANGIVAEMGDDSLTVTGCKGKPQGGGVVKTHLDHRIAMSFLVLGMVSKEAVRVDDGSAIATSFPEFISIMNRLGANITPLAPARAAKSGAVAATVSRAPMVIAIDGPAASGKGTLARRLAEHFDLSYLDTGSLYRAVGLRLVYADKDPNDKNAAIEAARAIDEEDLGNPRLRQERVGVAASIVSAIPEVRAILLDFQRQFAKRPGGAVLDGRDIGTVVCPDADLKLFITADLDARADRRHRELEGQGITVVHESVLDDLQERDERDSKRKFAPLKPASDAIHIDTTNLSAQAVFEKVLGIIEGTKAA